MSGARPLYPRKQTFVIAAARLDLECIATPPRDKLRSIVTPRGGLISEADEVADKDVLDAAIVGAAQAVEHYEIARYGTLIAWAETSATMTSSVRSIPISNKRRRRTRSSLRLLCAKVLIAKPQVNRCPT